MTMWKKYSLRGLMWKRFLLYLTVVILGALGWHQLSFIDNIDDKERNTILMKNYQRYLEIVKATNVKNSVLNLQAMEKLFESENFPEINNKTVKRTAIIIPYRNREKQLAIFLSHMYPIFKRQQMDFKIFIIQQSDGQPFNRGKLLNIGFVEARKFQKFDCYFLHDVDILLENDRCFYCNDNVVRHFSTNMNKFEYKEQKYTHKICNGNETTEQPVNLKYYGGVLRLNDKAMLQANGMSNIYWHWGAEDDDLYLRLQNSHDSLLRTSASHEECRFTMLEHGQEKKSTVKNFLLAHALSRQEYDGLNNLNYTVLGYDENQFYVNITVDIGSPAVKLVQSIPREISETTRCSVGDDWIKRNIFHRMEVEVKLYYFEIIYSRYLWLYLSLVCFICGIIILIKLMFRKKDRNFGITKYMFDC